MSLIISDLWEKIKNSPRGSTPPFCKIELHIETRLVLTHKNPIIYLYTYHRIKRFTAFTNKMHSLDTRLITVATLADEDVLPVIGDAVGDMFFAIVFSQVKDPILISIFPWIIILSTHTYDTCTYLQVA